MNYFFNWSFVSPQSSDPHSEFSSAFEPPSSPNILSFLLNVAMRRFTLWLIFMTYCSIHVNLTVAGSQGSFIDLLAMIRVLRFSAPSI